MLDVSGVLVGRVFPPPYFLRHTPPDNHLDRGWILAFVFAIQTVVALHAVAFCRYDYSDVVSVASAHPPNNAVGLRVYGDRGGGMVAAG
jgi:hypothetical protein